jgi:hypothetical protein
MPYVKREAKEALAAGVPIETPGNLTYLIQQLLKRYWKNSPQNYQAIAEILGSLQGARFDFEQRIVKDYERLKLKANGDVW